MKCSLLYSLLIAAACGGQVNASEVSHPLWDQTYFDQRVVAVAFDPKNGKQIAGAPIPFEKQRGNPEDLKKLTETGKCNTCDLRGFNIAAAYEQYRATQLASGKEINPITVRGSDLRHSNLTDGNFQGGDFAEADLTGSQCKNVNFKAANLGDASFMYANLANASLKIANIDGANFTKADLTNANFKKTWHFFVFYRNRAPQIKATFIDANIDGAKFTIGSEINKEAKDYIYNAIRRYALNSNKATFE